MIISVRALLRLLVPAVFIVAALFLRPYVAQLSQEQLVVLSYAPWFLGFISIALAIQFNRSRLLLLSVLTLVSYFLVQNQLQSSLSNTDTQYYYLTFAMALPLAALWLLMVPERGLRNGFGASYGLAVLGLLGLAWILAVVLTEQPPVSGVWVKWMQLWPNENLVLPRLLQLGSGLVAVFGLLMLCLRNSETEAALLIALLVLTGLLAFFYLPMLSLVLYPALCLGQVFSALRSSHEMAYRDELTGLLGRRALNERLQGLGRRYSIAMLDIDHFKKFNDTYGHDVGDEVLKLVATRISAVGGGGTAYRYGGEEFCVVFPRKSTEECVEALERVKVNIGDYKMSLRDHSQRPDKSNEGARQRAGIGNPKTVNVTISLGLAERDETDASPEEVIKQADIKLYKAKKAGRNQLSY
jgi:diguanylate cyclase (GGDEF)-like protein